MFSSFREPVRASDVPAEISAKVSSSHLDVAAPTSKMSPSHLGELSLERRAADPEELRGLRSVAARLLQHVEDVLALARVERSARILCRYRVAKIGGEVIDRNALAAAHDERSLECVAKLADVPRPTIFLERVFGALVDRDVLSRTSRELREEHAGQRCNFG